jgi:pantoate--beta-alanine ligase
MLLLDRVEPYGKALDAHRAQGALIGLVPTMGALHEGHLSLIEQAARECDVVVVSVYVNPLQFGPAEDLASYPRDVEGDRAKAAAAGADYVLAPSETEMFGVAPATTVHVAGLTKYFEGAVRPGHFDGVATIVTKLLALTGPCRAYFGEKDYQQLAVIRRLVKDLSFPVEVRGCPTVRDIDGLALSSRNAYLSAEERRVAPALFGALRAGKIAVEDQHVDDAGVVESIMAESIPPIAGIGLDYAAVADPDDLVPLRRIEGPVRLLIAARLGRTRLIDNLAARPQ